MWSKVKKAPKGYRPKRSTTAVSRNRTGEQTAFAVFPEGTLPSGRVDIYDDGRGRLAFVSRPTGTFKAREVGSCVKVYLPKVYHDRIPYGTADVGHSVDGDMLVIDLNSISTPQLAASA